MTEERGRVELSSQQEATMDDLVECEGADSARLYLLQRSSLSDCPCLSYAQQRMWFLNQMEPESPAYNVFSALRLSGDLDVSALRWALDALADRHEVLRTSFHAVDGSPVQVIAEKAQVPLSFQDLSETKPVGQDEEVHALARGEVERPFDLTQGPLMRALLMKLDVAQHVLILTLHHIVSDGWSRGIISRDLMTLYEAGRKPGSSVDGLPELAIQYADFAKWQREYLSGEVLASLLDYWRNRLANITPLNLPTDSPRRNSSGYRGALKRFELAPELTFRLNALGRETGSTPFMLLLAAFEVLLHRYTGQTDIAVGSPIANRNRTEVEDLIGLFVNTLVMRGDLSGDPTFRELLRRTREGAIEAFAHQDLPFDRLVEDLNPERHLTRNPLFQVMFAVQNVPSRPLALGGLQVTPYPLEVSTTRLDLEVYVGTDASRVVILPMYNTDLFESATIDRMFEHYLGLLQAVVNRPDAPISTLALLSGEEREKLLREWNQTDAARPSASVVSLFERHASLRPEAVAAVWGDEALSYGELNRRANRLARYLQERGVGVEVPVGIVMQRSAGLLVAILGVSKAGGAYVAMDPDYPAARWRYMVEDSGCRVVVTDDAVGERLGTLPVPVVRVDGDWDEISERTGENLEIETTPSNIAYVIYTSGSTGEPKGIGVPHRGLLNLSLWHQKAYHVKPDDRATQVAGLGFDASVWELWPYLISGASVHFPDEETRLSPSALLSWMAAAGVTLSFLPTPLAEAVLLEEMPGSLSLRVLFTGGDRLHRAPRAGLPFALFNHYGPTECSVVTTAVEVRPRESNRMPPIGRPVENLKVYVLDTEMSPVPVGIPGELFIGGEGVARGYVARPDLTAEKFVPDPFDARGGARLYRSGDCVRWRDEGTLEFLGRGDQQVKIRGFRVELGEVENALLGCPGVREAVAAIRDDGKGSKRLVAYVVPGLSRGLIPRLKEHLAAKLPDYMVPSALVELEELPRNASGKVDRAKLPAPGSARPELANAYVPPRGPIEEGVVSIWSDVLGVDRIGVHDDFFELGGHSLLATQVISRMRQAFHVEVPLRSLFESPTVAGLSLRVAEALSAGDRSEQHAIRALARNEPLPLSFAQERLWFLDRLEPGNPAFNMGLAVRLEGRLDEASLEKSLRELVRRHEPLRTHFVEVEGEPRQRVGSPQSFALEIEDLGGIVDRESREEEARRLVLQDLRRPFDLALGPPFRARLIRLQADEHVLVLGMHHIVSDGWSKGVLLRELGALYEAFHEGQPSPLPELPLQYSDYAVWQRERLMGEFLARELDYWREKLSGAPPALALPFDRPRPKRQTFRGGQQVALVSEELTERLKELSRKNGVTLFMTLLSALKILLSRYSGQTDIVVGSPIANRNRAEIEGLIGFFLNTLALRTDLSGNPTFEDALSREREVAVSAFAHQEVPFEMLLTKLHPERDLRHTPWFQVFFNMLSFEEASLSLPGLAVSPFATESENAKFDLTLYVLERRGRLMVVANYNRDLLDERTITRLLSHYQKLLSQCAARPAERVSDFEIVTEEEKVLLPDPSEEIRDEELETVWDRLCHFALRKREAAAIRMGDRELSYGELRLWAEAIARNLLERGLEAGDVVALKGRRGVELVVALLGVMRARGAFLLVDESLPEERREMMVAESGASIVLPLDGLPTGGNGLAPVPGEGPSADDAAYVFFTSGSTGSPRAVVGTHKGLSHFVAWQRDEFGIGAEDRVAQLVSPSFDAILRDIFLPLSSGGLLAIPEVAVDLGADDILSWLEREKVTVIHTVPALAESWLADAAATRGALPDLRYVFFSGEALRWELVRRWRGKLGDTAAIVNLYGPTETTMTKSFYVVPRDTPEEGVVPLGEAIPGAQLLVLGEGKRRCGLGETGEIAIRTPYRTLGYRTGTAEVPTFVENPYRRDPGDLLYYTGDLGRYGADGSLHYLGRRDSQLKVRGARVQPSEVEQALRRHPDIRESAVTGVACGAETRLVAYCVPLEGRKPPDAALRRFLLEKLPEYMVPSVFVPIDSIPRTASGKLDRKALPEPSAASSLEARRKIPPRTPVERELAILWRELLGVDEVSVHDNFFDLGGHSLLSTRLISRMRRAFGVEIPLRRVFESETLEALAMAVTEARLTNEDQEEILRLMAEIKGTSLPTNEGR